MVLNSFDQILVDNKYGYKNGYNNGYTRGYNDCYIVVSYCTLTSFMLFSGLYYYTNYNSYSYKNKIKYFQYIFFIGFSSISLFKIIFK